MSIANLQFTTVVMFFLCFHRIHHAHLVTILMFLNKLPTDDHNVECVLSSVGREKCQFCFGGLHPIIAVNLKNSSVLEMINFDPQ